MRAGSEELAASGEMEPFRPATEPANLRSLLRRAERGRRVAAFVLVSVPFSFVLIAFVVPILAFLSNSVDNALVPKALPRTAAALRNWNRQAPPDEDTFRALVLDLREASDAGLAGMLGARLNQNIAGFRTMITRAARVPVSAVGQDREAVVVADQRWGDVQYWRVLAQESGRFTPYYLLAALDLRLDRAGGIVRAPDREAIYLEVVGRTLLIAAVSTLLTLVLGYPVAYLLANVSRATANLLLLLVLLPFWTSVLVRTTAWLVLLQERGVINQVLMWLRVVDAPAHLVYNRLGVHIGIVYVCLPFMVLPLYSTMTTIPREHMRAAMSLGASRFTAFRRVYLPQSLPGVVAGSVIVGVTVTGYYITPLLLGGPRDQMLSYYVALFVNETLNWGMAAALALVLLVMVLGGLLAATRVLGLGKLTIR